MRNFLSIHHCISRNADANPCQFDVLFLKLQEQTRKPIIGELKLYGETR